MKRKKLPNDWKIITGTILFAMAESLPMVLPQYVVYQPLVYTMAILLGGVGVSDRMNKIRKAINKG